MNTSSCLKQQGLDDDIGYEASPGEPLPIFFQIISLGPKMAHPGADRFYIGLYKAKPMPETIRLRALIIGMQHYLVDLNQVCANHAPWAKSGPAQGVTRDMVSYQQIPICKL